MSFLTIEGIARVCHEANRILCEVISDLAVAPSWEGATAEQRASVIAGVRFTLANPAATPEDQHLEWLASKTIDGWKWGPKKDEVLKTHPCCCPYHDLPKAQRVKDALFQRIIRSLPVPTPAGAPDATLVPFQELSAICAGSPEEEWGNLPRQRMAALEAAVEVSKSLPSGHLQVLDIAHAYLAFLKGASA